MDSYTPERGSVPVERSHAEDFSLRAIILFIVILVISAGLTFAAAGGLMHVFEWWASIHEPEPTPAQQQLKEQRGQRAQKEGVRPQPDWYNREIDAKAVEKTFATPRLQDNDADDMNFFLASEKDRLQNTGKDPDGTIHIPIDRAITILSERGLPQVTGTFTPGPPKGDLLAVSEAAQRRVNQTKTGAPEKK